MTSAEFREMQRLAREVDSLIDDMDTLADESAPVDPELARLVNVLAVSSAGVLLRLTQLR
jgi:hypothetical protein